MRLIIMWIFNFGILESFALFLVAVNVLTFALYVVDKKRAKKGAWRINEKTLLFFTVMFGGFAAFAAMYLVRHKTRKRAFIVAMSFGMAVSAVSVVHIVHSLTFARVVRYVELEFTAANWPTELNGYRIAFMTDFHTITPERISAAITELNGKNIDLLLLGGDFSMRDAHYQGVLAAISQATTTDGIFGVEGNHDDYIRLFAAKRENGIIPLDNSGVQIRQNFFLAGVHDMWNRTPNIQQAIQNANSSDFVLLISHNPDLTMVQPTNAVDLILSGHTHGGQITFFGFPFYLWRGSITAYGTRFAYGFANSADGTPVFTSSGIGDYYGIPRVFTRPEVVIFNMFG